MSGGTFNNLSIAPIPGNEFLMPGGIGGLGGHGIAGEDFNFGGMQSLYANPFGAGDGGGVGGDGYAPREGELTDAESSIVINVALSPFPDGSHMDDQVTCPGYGSESSNGSLLFKHVPAFILKEPPSQDDSLMPDQRPPAIVVPVYWLNMFIKKHYDIGFRKFTEFALDFVRSHQSHFPQVFESKVQDQKISGGTEVNYLNQTSSILGLGYGDDDDDDDDSDDQAIDSYFQNFSASVSGRTTSYSSHSSGHGNVTVEDDKDILKAFILYLHLNLPDTDLFYTPGGKTQWLSSTFSISEKIRSHLSALKESLRREEEERSNNRLDVSLNKKDLDSDSEYLKNSRRDLTDGLEDYAILKTMENNYCDESSGGNTRGRSSHIRGMANSLATNILDKPSSIPLLKHAIELAEEKEVMLQKVIKFFSSPRSQPKIMQLANKPLSIDYLFRGGILDSWFFMGIVDTVTDDTGGKHRFGKPFSTYPLVKIVTEREYESKNVWGLPLRKGTPLYFLVQRRDKRERGAAMFDDEDPMSMILAAYFDYDSYEIVPYYNIKTPLAGVDITQPDMTELNLCGRKELVSIIHVGTVKYDCLQLDYDDSLRNTAMGLFNKDGITPGLKNAKEAMIGLPDISIIVRRNR